MSAPRLLIAGVGNVLRGDDGFGIALAHLLQAPGAVPESVRVIETGIGGISLVQELMAGYDAFLVLDAVDRGGAPGQLYLLDADVPDVSALSPIERQSFLADLHFANPTRALMLARAVGVLPPRVSILGCQSCGHDVFEIGLSDPVREALPAAVRRVEAWVAGHPGPAPLAPAPRVPAAPS